MGKGTWFLDWLVIVLAVVLGVGSIALFAWEGRPSLFNAGWAPATALAWDALLSLLFFAQHSGMVRRPFRAWLLRTVVAERYDAAVYASASGLVLALVLLLWQRTEPPLFVVPAPWRWMMGTAAGLAVLVFALSARALRPFDMLGLRPIRAHLRNRPPQQSPFVVRGTYRWVRHPLYSCVIVLLWAEPDIRADSLLMSILWTAWIVGGAVLEERDLVSDFGERYRRYQQLVPMLVPRHGPRDVPQDEPLVGV